MRACPSCEAPSGYSADTVNGLGYCMSNRTCVENERGCEPCDFTGYTRDPDTYERIPCQVCEGRGSRLSHELEGEVSL